MEIIKMDDINYILGDYILKNAPIYSKGCRSSRDLVRQKKIPAANYIYVRNINNTWIKTEGKSVKFDKVIIKEEILNTIPELKNNNEVISDSQEIEKAPGLILLSDSEKFKDNDGNVIEIETRGERNVNNIYFKVKDVADNFKMNNLINTILSVNTNYKEFNHYKYFIDINKSKKELFLTYEGLLRVLFVSRNGKTAKFIKWATETLFTVQLGTPEQKRRLTADILGINAKVIKEVFNCDANTLPCIYLFTLGYVKDLRESMNISKEYEDNSIIAKYGMTKNLSRRTTEHLKHYKTIDGCELKLKYYSYIDPQYISVGESDIREFINSLDLKLTFNNEEELIVIPNKFIKLISEKYEHIGKKYSGHVSELITRIKELEDTLEKQELKHNLEMQKLYNEKEKAISEIQSQKEKSDLELRLQKEKYENELLKKDYQLLLLQNKLDTKIN
jgi:hypothetical protein